MSTWKRTVDELLHLYAPHRIPVDVGDGTCALAITANPFRDQLPIQLCWAVLASWLPAASPVGMFITIRAYTPAGESERALEVSSLWAVPELRGRRPETTSTLPVALGRWLVTERLITHHSPDRTDAGDRWAQAIGGHVPERDQRGSVDGITRSSHDAISRLNEEAWTEPEQWPSWPPANWVHPLDVS